MSARRRIGRGAALAGALAWVALVGLAAGCGGRKGSPVAPPPPPPPEIEQVVPAPRAVHVQPETEIWARFREPLDPTTVTDRNVFLKLDAGRIASTIDYDPATRTIHVVPLETLRLFHTYTVEITPRVATESGGALADTWFWQFTITSLRRLEHPWPPNGATVQSPVSALGWDPNDPEAGSMRYEVWTGADSASVAARTSTPTVVYAPWRMARTRFSFATRVWWTVDATNLTSGERASGPTWSFVTADSLAAVDSLVVPVRSFGSPGINRPTNPICTGTSLGLGPNSNLCIRWDIEHVPRGLRLAGARILLWPTLLTTTVNTPVVFGSPADFDGCLATYPNQPAKDAPMGTLAIGTFQLGGPITIRSDLLSAHVQAAVLFDTPYGYVFSANNNLSIFSPLNDNAAGRPSLTLYYYRDPPGAGLAARDPRSAALRPAFELY